jgi:hypothetical protein
LRIRGICGDNWQSSRYGYYEGFVIQHDGENQGDYFSDLEMGSSGFRSDLQIEPEKWTYLAITVDKNMITAYLDGRKVTSADATDVIKTVPCLCICSTD